MMALPGAPPRVLMEFPARQIQGLAWSPDGARLLFMAYGAPGQRIMIVDRAGRLLRNETITWANFSFAWEAGGNAVLLTRQGEGVRGWRTYRLDLARSDPPLSTDEMGWGTITLGDDGQRYALRADPDWTHPTREVWRLGPGRARRVYPALAFPRDRIDWTVARGLLWMPDASVPGHPRIVGRSLADGHIVRDFETPGRARWLHGLAIDPRSGAPAYLREVTPERDIALVRLERR